MSYIIHTQGLFDTKTLPPDPSKFGVPGGNNASISKICFDYIRKILPDGKTILELGSGWGTSALSKYYKMYSIEHDIRFINSYDSTYIHAPIKLYNDKWKAPNIPQNDGWFDVDKLSKLSEIKYDLILVDGPPGWLNSAGPGKTIGRGGFYKHLDLFNTNVPIIIDDINREAEKILLEKLSKKLNKTYTILNDEVTGIIK